MPFYPKTTSKALGYLEISLKDSPTFTAKVKFTCNIDFVFTSPADLIRSIV
jgi:hypothetical protein